MGLVSRLLQEYRSDSIDQTSSSMIFPNASTHHPDQIGGDHSNTIPQVELYANYAARFGDIGPSENDNEGGSSNRVDGDGNGGGNGEQGQQEDQEDQINLNMGRDVGGEESQGGDHDPLNQDRDQDQNHNQVDITFGSGGRFDMDTTINDNQGIQDSNGLSNIIDPSIMSQQEDDMAGFDGAGAGGNGSGDEDNDQVNEESRGECNIAVIPQRKRTLFIADQYNNDV